MPLVALPGHFDGEKVCLDEPFDLKPGTRLIVTVLGEAEPEDERAGWALLSQQGLAGAYAEDEPGYPEECIREVNPEYEGGQHHPHSHAPGRRHSEEPTRARSS